ncbi:LmeA family phospholipid-binding protein [Microbacterium sp. CPCC 204701]|uniref:LmeA family phospholipid-binding protein n=1 Tax=Microbacterium sp. CPCC 204701 TaxID=2493084 RepID=UPI000FDC9272|nr:DUF2993 domain-containing protein [Microbacterium sp. CPCC 204701]
MSADDTRPTLPLPDWEHAEAPRRRAWPWLVAFGIVIVLAVVAWFAAEVIARQIVTGVVRDQVRSQLALPESQPIDVDIPGAMIPQLVGGTLDELTMASDDVEVGRFAGDVVVVAQDVPIRGGSMGGATATVTLDEEQLRGLVSTIAAFPADTVSIDAPVVTMSMRVPLFGVGVPVGVALTPDAVDGDIVLTPASLRLAGAEVGADALRDQFGQVADLVLRDWTVCVAQYLPAGVTLTDVAVDGEVLVAGFDVDGAITTDPALRATGSCE